MAWPEDSMKLPTGGGANSLTPEQRDTVRLIDQFLGKALADRYTDFCRIMAGDFDLKVGIPMAGHSLREFDSILRSALAAPLDAKIETGLSKEQLREIDTSLKKLGYDDSAINRAKAALAPRVNHVEQIKKIVTRLGLDPAGDVARNWLH